MGWMRTKYLSESCSMVSNQSPADRSTFLVWDGEGQPPEGDWIPVLWRRFSEADGASAHSIPTRLEDQADALRARFLGWLYDLGEAHIDGRRLVDCLAMRPGFSYWWTTLLVEKSYAKSSRLLDAIKLLALEDLVGANAGRTIILASGDKTLTRAFRQWCGNAGLAFQLQRLKPKAAPVSLVRKLYSHLPHPVQALLTLLRHLRQRWPLRQSGAPSGSMSGKGLTIVDYLFHLSPKALLTGQFASNYWTDLIGVLSEETVRVNWLHHFVGHQEVPTARHARNLIARFNQNSAKSQSHMTLDGALSWSVIISAARDYCRLVLAGMHLRSVRKHFRPANSKVYLWPLFEQDWRRSLFGTAAISNTLFLNLLEHTLKTLPHQAVGVYLQENQGWEMAFVHAWKAAGHGRLIAVPHSVVRYWDLRYFFDPRSYQRGRPNDLPLPDIVAANGAATVSTLRNAGYPEGRMEEVEALRYLYLADLPPRPVLAEKGSPSPLRVLILTDYVPSVTDRQMQWLAQAARLLPMDTRYIVKTHPACPVEPSDYPSLQLKITRSPLAELFSSCDVAFASNITASAVDAYSARIPVVSVLDGEAFNMSPLRGLAGVAFVTGPIELAHALGHLSERKGACTTGAYFCLDKRLPRWRRLLGLRAPAALGCIAA